MICPFLFVPAKKGNLPMSTPAFEQKTNPNLTTLQVEQTLLSEEKLKREIEQFIRSHLKKNSFKDSVIKL